MIRIVSIGLLALFCLLQYKLWFATNGVIQTLALRHTIHRQEAMNRHLAHNNQLLSTTLQQLKQRSAIEGLARDQLGLIKPGEVYYEFVTAPEPHPSTHIDRNDALTSSKSASASAFHTPALLSRSKQRSRHEYVDAPDN